MKQKKPADSPLVSVEAVGYRYPHSATAALDNIQLSISAGSCFGLLGPNGAGKTTLISLLTGILTPQQGNIKIGGFSFPNEAKSIKQISSLVPQDYAFYPSLTGFENLQFFARLNQVQAAKLSTRLDYCVEVCGLSKVLKQRASEYSGGIKRRLNLAIGLLNTPQILYLDEPTVGIDAQSRHFILEAIKQLNAEGVTIIYTSHYMEEVELLCDDIAIVDHGHVLLQDHMANLLNDNRKMVVKPTRTLEADTLTALQKTTNAVWDGSQLTLTPSAQAPLSQVLIELELAGIEVEQLHSGANKLEEIYLGVTKRELRQ